MEKYPVEFPFTIDLDNSGVAVFALNLTTTKEGTPVSAWLDLLDTAEQQRSASFISQKNHFVFIAAHALKRLALTTVLQESRPKDLRFVYDQYGKPSLFRNTPYSFNLSHTTDFVALALSPGGAVGIDIERSNPEVMTSELAASIFTHEECTTLAKSDKWIDSFSILWTAKEAVMKAEGKGLRLSPESIYIDQSYGFSPSGRWNIWQTHPTIDHALSLAWRGKSKTLHYYQLDPTTLTSWSHCYD